LHFFTPKVFACVKFVFFRIRLFLSFYSFLLVGRWFASVEVHNQPNIYPSIKKIDQILVVVEIRYKPSAAVFTPKAFSCGQVFFF